LRLGISGNGDVYHFVDGEAPSINLPVATWPNGVHTGLGELTPIVREIDIMTRDVAVNTVDAVIVRDSHTESMVTGYGVKGGKATILVGTDGLDYTDYLQIYAGYVDSVRTSEKEIFLKIKSYTKKIVAGSTAYNKFQIDHPIDLISDLVVSVLDADFDDIGDHTKYSDISHLVASDMAWVNFTQEHPKLRPVIDLAQPLLDMIDAGLETDESGQLTLYRTPTSGAADEDWTDDDIGEFEVISLYENLINKIEIETHPAGEMWNSFSRWPFRSETTEHDGFYTRKIRHPYINGMGQIGAGVFTGPSVPAASGTFGVWGGAISFAAGCYNPNFPSATWLSSRQVDGSTRSLYIRIQDEIVRVSAVNLIEEHIGEMHYMDVPTYEDFGENTYVHPVYAEMTVAERGALGTTAAAHTTALPWYDVTAQVIQAQRILDRFANGAFVVRVTTGPEKYPVTIGDIVTLATPRFL
jgi:hypothetical protein